MIIKSNFEKICGEKNNHTVVVADENAKRLISIGFVLDALKLEYYFANNGKTALDLVYEKKPNLVLLNAAMPYLNGIEVNTLIKSDLFTNHISTIAIVERTEPKHMNAIEAEFDDYIVQPFTIENLEAKIKRFTKK